MIAEIYGKISKTGSNLSEISEDELTGNVFGSLRYLAFDEGLKQILINAVYPEDIAYSIEKINAFNWSDSIEFWPYDNEGELDAYIEFENIAIGIEAKYTSGLSSDDGMDYSESDDITTKTESKHQLQRECRIISKKAGSKEKMLLLVANSMSCADIFSDVRKRKLLQNTEVSFGYLTWQSILRELRKLTLNDPFKKVVINDLISLLSRKGFEQFYSMKLNSGINIDANKFFCFNYSILL